MSKKQNAFPSLEELDALDAAIEKQGAHYKSGNVTHDVVTRVNTENHTVTHDAAPQPNVTHGTKVRVTTYLSPELAGKLRELIKELDRSESWVVNAMIADALAAKKFQPEV